ncbi:MAG TPA: NAD-dependent epimerase/dehydratase family protein, partial [Vicinamibacterales bacterium]|nr:NAD-dependent epimerase/dehydratase family protein [Vicinamibacterales bacterium]
MKALIFGANGQDGHYLIETLKSRNVDAVGVSRSGDWVRGDVGRLADVETLVREHKPHYIFHLAARSTTRHDALFENHETISTGSLNVLECA